MEALAAFDDQTNGFVAAQADHVADAMQFNEHEIITQGLGPLYNADSCGSCHLNPVTGGISEVTELRAGHHDSSGLFMDARGGSLINSNDPAFRCIVQDAGALLLIREPPRASMNRPLES